MNVGNFRGRKAASIENDAIRVTILAGGAHVAEILHKPTGVDPLWKPHWPSIEPSAYRPEIHRQYGTSDEAIILAGIMGHSICLDTYGAPSAEEFAAGIPVHGEGPTVDYTVDDRSHALTVSGTLPLAQLVFEREIRLHPDGERIHFNETLENLSSTDRPIAWIQHVTLGLPFLEPGKTQFRAATTKSKSAGADFGDENCAQAPDAEFDGFACPRKGGGVIDLRVFPEEAVSGGFTTHLMDPRRDDSFFAAWSPTSRVLFGYVWKRNDFPWLCRWEENHVRQDPPWNGKTVACGMEFGTSPVLGSRRKLVELGTLFGTPAYRWIPAKSRLRVEYWAFLRIAETIPENVRWHTDGDLRFE
jgi:hypothetical protein